MQPTELTPEILVTFAFLIGGVGLAAAMVWVEKRPHESFQPRLIPTTLLMFLGVFVALLATVHLFNLYGVRTGQ